MRYYVEAFYPDCTQILGNGDGQAVLRCDNPRNTKHIKNLLSGRNRPLYQRVAFWRVVDANGKLDMQFANHLATP